MINDFSSFLTALYKTGFSTSGSSMSDVFSLCGEFGDKISWHTADPETDPWQWRVRVLTERNDIAYSKVFLQKGGYITKEWYPYFLAVRRQGRSFEYDYTGGNISNYAKRVYSALSSNGSQPSHTLKRLAGFTREENSKFEKALLELQMKMYITISGISRKVSSEGEEYGWESMVYCTTESFFGAQVFDEASRISPSEAADRITERILSINPAADMKKTRRFIYG